MFSQADQELEWVRGRVAARFPVYETKVTEQAVQFLVNVDPATMEAKFDELRLELVPKDYIPFLAKHGGEYAVVVQRRAPQRFVGTHVNLLLLGLTLVTTTIAGALNWSGYDNIDWASFDAFAKGSLFFTLPLLAILGFHEMAHYVVAKRYKVQASLPFFLPAPPTPLGTFGAMISMRDPIPSRKALLDIGASGPLVGLLTAVPVTLIGLFLMQVDPRPVPPNTGGGLNVNLPVLYQVLAYFVPVPTDVLLHPTAFAGWVGLFVTALNLLPAGQLDGGHVARAVLGENGKYVSYGATLLMLLLGFAYEGWFIIAIFILLLGARHPPPLNDLTSLDLKRHGLAVIAASLLVLSFAAVPLTQIRPEANIQFEAVDAPDVPVAELSHNVTRGDNVTFSFHIVNKGNVRTEVSLELFLIDFTDFPSTNLSVSLENVTIGTASGVFGNGTANFAFDSKEVANVTLRIDASAFGPELPTGDWRFTVRAQVDGEGLAPRNVEFGLILGVE